MGALNPTGSEDGHNVEILCHCDNAGMEHGALITAKSKLAREFHLTEGGGEAWAGQLRL